MKKKKKEERINIGRGKVCELSGMFCGSSKTLLKIEIRAQKP